MDLEADPDSGVVEVPTSSPVYTAFINFNLAAVYVGHRCFSWIFTSDFLPR
jgi:hypothetical protein